MIATATRARIRGGASVVRPREKASSDPVGDSPKRAKVVGRDLVDLDGESKGVLNPSHQLEHARGVDDPRQASIELYVEVPVGNGLGLYVGFDQILDFHRDHPYGE